MRDSMYVPSPTIEARIIHVDGCNTIVTRHVGIKK
jgi:hypothetical protein